MNTNHCMYAALLEKANVWGVPLNEGACYAYLKSSI